MKALTMLLALFTAGLVGFGSSIERTALEDRLMAFIPRREPTWLRDLEPGYQDLVNVLKKKGFLIDENAAICKQMDIVGHYTWWQPTIKLCTNRISKVNSNPLAFRTLLQQTIAHEATHVAQSCRQRRDGKPSLGLAAARLYRLPQSIRSDIEKSIAINRSSNTRSVQWRVEAEAMAMEDTPEQVIAALQRFCR